MAPATRLDIEVIGQTTKACALGPPSPARRSFTRGQFPPMAGCAYQWAIRCSPASPLRFPNAGDKTHFIADCKLVERPARDAVAVEINFTAVGSRDEPVVFLREKPDDAPVIGHSMQLDLAPIDTRVILDLAAGGIESVADGD